MHDKAKPKDNSTEEMTTVSAPGIGTAQTWRPPSIISDDDDDDTDLGVRRQLANQPPRRVASNEVESSS